MHALHSAVTIQFYLYSFIYIYSFIYSYLLSLQGEFDEDLLQFLVDKVDAKLLKTVSLRKRIRHSQ